MIKTSKDGSHTVFSEQFQVTYHSMHGAVTESQVVFIDAGLEYLIEFKKQHISVFEMGFGTGLNAFLTALWAEKNAVLVDYTAIEAYPLQDDQYAKLNYIELLGRQEVYYQICKAEWNKKEIIHPYFNVYKIPEALEHYKSDARFDIIFFDAFGPGAQPELWEASVMDKMYAILSENGVLVTYCSQGQFRRNLKQAGFYVKKLPGPPGKREIVRAVKW